MKILSPIIVCDSRESAKALANLAKWIPARGESHQRIDIEEKIGAEGWSDIQRLVDHLADVVGVEYISLFMVGREPMVAEAEDHMKAIWSKVSSWDVWGLVGRGEGWWMTEEELLEEAEKQEWKSDEELEAENVGPE